MAKKSMGDIQFISEQSFVCKHENCLVETFKVILYLEPYENGRGYKWNIQRDGKVEPQCPQCGVYNFDY